jgi:hypothetical protein
MKLSIAAVLVFSIIIVQALRTRHAQPSLWMTLVVSALAIGELVAASKQLPLTAPSEFLRYKPAWISRLDARGAIPPRLFVETPPPESKLKRYVAGWTFDQTFSLGIQDALAPGIGGRWGLSGSYDGDATGLAPRPLTVLSLMIDRIKGLPLAWRLLRMGSVDYFVSLASGAFTTSCLERTSFMASG